MNSQSTVSKHDHGKPGALSLNAIGPRRTMSHLLHSRCIQELTCRYPSVSLGLHNFNVILQSYSPQQHPLCGYQANQHCIAGRGWTCQAFLLPEMNPPSSGFDSAAICRLSAPSRAYLPSTKVECSRRQAPCSAADYRIDSNQSILAVLLPRGQMLWLQKLKTYVMAEAAGQLS